VGTEPLLTIRCATYNHRNFVDQTIEGFLMQETDFPVRIVIHDDASNDGTREMLLDYQARYPGLFELVLQDENQYSLGHRPGFFLQPRMRGKFVALCEGDDLWTDSRKLAMQVQLLRANKQASACGHWASLIDAASALATSETPKRPAAFINTRDLLFFNPLDTCTVVYRRSALSEDIFRGPSMLPMQDWPLYVSLSLSGPILCIQREMAAYRRHRDGVWSSSGRPRQLAVCCAFLEVASLALPRRFVTHALVGFRHHLRLLMSETSQQGEGSPLAKTCSELLLSAGCRLNAGSKTRLIFDQEIARAGQQPAAPWSRHLASLLRRLKGV
jgi:hypothetical protein